MDKKIVGLIVRDYFVDSLQGRLGDGFQYLVADPNKLWRTRGDLQNFVEENRPHLLIVQTKPVEDCLTNDFDLRGALEATGVPFCIVTTGLKWGKWGSWFPDGRRLGFGPEDIFKSNFFDWVGGGASSHYRALAELWTKPVKVLWLNKLDFAPQVRSLVFNLNYADWIVPWQVDTPENMGWFDQDPVSFLAQFRGRYDVIMIDPADFFTAEGKIALTDCGIPFILNISAIVRDAQGQYFWARNTPYRNGHLGFTNADLGLRNVLLHSRYGRSASYFRTITLQAILWDQIPH